MTSKLDKSLDELIDMSGSQASGNHRGYKPVRERRRGRDRVDMYDGGRRQRSPPRQQNHQHQLSCKVYVGNLAYSVGWRELKDHLRQAGNVIFADVLSGSDGRSKGCGIAEFATIEDAENAIRTLNDTDLNGRPIFVREDRELNNGSNAAPPPPQAHSRGFDRGNRDDREFRNFGQTAGRANRGGGGGGGGDNGDIKGRQVYVGNLAYKTAWQDIKDLFRTCGDVERADIMMDGEGRSRGFGLVLFTTYGGAERAIARLNNAELHGRQMFVRLDEMA